MPPAAGLEKLSRLHQGHPNKSAHIRVDTLKTRDRRHFMERFIDLLASFAPHLLERAQTASYLDAKSIIMRPIAADIPNLLAFLRSRSEPYPQFAHST
jgi:hypothetical protein